MSMPALRTSAPAKVNLGLRVTARRPDGFHELRSLFLRLRLADDVRLADAVGASDTLVVEGDPDCPVDGNLALRACAAFRAAVSGGVRLGPVAVRLRKRIPMEAGLAGGSSDAAAVVRLLARRHPGALDDARRAELARSLGADVPFFLDAAGAALVSGVGEAVEPLPPPVEPLGVLLVRPDVGLSTARVFGAWDALHQEPAPGAGPSVLDLLASELRAGASPSTIVGFASRLREANDLWPAAVAVEPRMPACRDALEDRLGRPVLMTGSGSTLVALHEDPSSAVAAAEALRASPPRVLGDAWVGASVSGTPYPPEVDIVEEGS